MSARNLVLAENMPCNKGTGNLKTVDHAVVRKEAWGEEEDEILK